MAQESWRLDDTSVADGSTFTRVGSSFHLYNNSGATVSRTTTSPTPIQGSGCYRFNDASTAFFLRTSSGSELTAGVFYVDYYIYLPTTFNSDNYQLLVTGNDSTTEYGVASVFSDGSIGWASYDIPNGFVQTPISAAGVVPKGEWVRVAVRTNSTGPSDIKIFKGKNINGTTADTSISTAFYYNSWEWVGIACANASGSAPWFDSVILSDTAYPTRLEGVASLSGTASSNSAVDKTPIYISSVSYGVNSGTANNKTSTVTLPNLVSGDTVICVATEYGLGDDFYLQAPSSSSLTLTSQISQSSAKFGQAARRKLVVSTAQVTNSVTAPQITVNIVAANNLATASYVYTTAYVLKGAASSAFGAKTSSTSTTNNLTTNSITTTGGSSTVFAFAFDGELSINLDTTDLYLPGSAPIGLNAYPGNIGSSSVLGGWSGWKLASTSGSTVTANFDGQSTNTVDWMYGLLEVLQPSATSISASGSETASGTAGANYSTSVSASGSVTASASGSVFVGKIIDASGSITDTGSASATKTLNADATGTVTVSGVTTATVTSGTKTADAAGSVTDSATAALTKTQTLSGIGQITVSGVSSLSLGQPLSGLSQITASGIAQVYGRTVTISAVGQIVVSATAQESFTVAYYLVNPIVEEGLVEYDPYYNLIRNNVGVTVVKRNGTWQSVRNKVDGWLQECDVVFRGGHENQVNATQKAELEAAGYTVETRYL